jgi:hypothetical protein
MKKYSLIFAFLLIIPFTAGQISQDEDGLYYDEQNELYTGTYSEYFDSGKVRLTLNISEGILDGE